MEDDIHKPGLYRWQRQAKPRVYSRAQKVATTDDIQDWLQKVEQASSKAAETVLGCEGVSPYTAGRHRGHARVKGASDHARIQDEAYSEAQDLLNEWITQKVSLHDDDLEDDPDLAEHDPWRKEELGSKARREWDQLLNGNLDELGTDQPTPRFTLTHTDEGDPYANLYDLEDDEAVSTVLRTMLDKDLVKDSVRRDLGFDHDTKAHDPRTKMALRHQRVKENREKREKELKRQRNDAETKKQARLAARHIVMKEEKVKEIKVKREEHEVRKQMTQIRKEMQETRRQEAEERLRSQQEAEEKARRAREEVERQEAAERQEMFHRAHEMKERKQAKLAQRELEKARQAAHKLRILHKNFTAWYDVVLYRRLCYGKARAMADWKLTLRMFNAWHSYTRSQRITIETKQHEHNVVEENRKAMVAKKHHYLYQLRKHFCAWRDFVSQQEEKQRLEQAQEATRSKMMKLLSAVADGSLGEGRQGETGIMESDRKEKTTAHGGAHKVVDELHELFKQPARRTAWEEDSDTSPFSSSRPQSSLSSASASRMGQGQRIPMEPWQITRKHAQLSKEEMARLMHAGSPQLGEEGSEVTSQHSDTKIRRRFGTQPWMNRHYTVNNMEHRFNAQQKLLKEQQAAIKEQKRMIQDLVFTQQTQEHQEQLQQISPDKQPAVTGSDGPFQQAVQQTERGEQGKASGDKARPSSAAPAQASAQPASRHPLSDGGDTHRTDSSTARSGHSEVTSTSTAASAATSKTQNTKYLQVLKNMDDRAAERTRLKAERDEKRRQAEDERLERLKAEEEELKRKAEEEKQARVQAYRDRKRLEKQKEEEKKKGQERERELTMKADDHYLKALMKFRVLFPMKKMIHMAKEETHRAEQHHNHHILRQVMRAWKSHTDELTAEKKQLADDLHGYIVVRRCFQSWKNFKYRMVFLERRAERHHRDVILPQLFQAWSRHTAEEKTQDQERRRVADHFYPRSVQRKVFHAWRRLPQELKREAEREKLRSEMRKKVADLLPDFKPTVSVSHSTDSVP
ncbi:coiled-coil domain-containing protein 191-like [Littorina saxatilis]|uniref:coiled-coil domain-containing protein 191-like n=1 Tax=Littorina saxatilis TaxID=31220 RepID=UPI0038B51468